MSGHYTRLNWRKQSHCFNANLTPQLKSWLFDSASLTSRLIKYSNNNFSVKMISVKRATPTADEIFALGLKARSHALIREVLLCCANEPVVYARTIIPASSLRGALRGLVLLGNKPLGAVLFADKLMHRKHIEVAQLQPKNKCYAWSGYEGDENIWGRRSVFVLKKQSLLVSEFFLPTLFK